MPVLGNLLSVHQFTHRGLAKLSKIHGGFFHLRVGQVNVFVVSSPETVREIIHENDSVFSHRPVTAAMVYVSYDLADMAFAHYGPFWRQMRKLCVLKLFSPRRDVSWRVVRGEVDALVRSVAELRRVAGSVGDLVFKFATNVTFRAAFGAQSREDEKVFVDIILELSEIFMAFNMGDYIPCLGWLDLNGIGKRMAAARHALDVFIDRIIDEHLAKLRNGDVSASDMVDDMIAYLVDAPGGRHKRADGVELGDLHLTRDNIKGLIMDIMFGGTKTVASTVEWALSELLRNPDELRRAQDELAGVVGLRRRVNQDDLDNLPHLRCVTKEVLRLHPPLPLLLRESLHDCAIGGLHCPSRVAHLDQQLGHVPRRGAVGDRRGGVPAVAVRRRERARGVQGWGLPVPAVRVRAAVVPGDAAGDVRRGARPRGAPALLRLVAASWDGAARARHGRRVRAHRAQG